MRKSLVLASLLLGSSIAVAQAPTTTSTQVTSRPVAAAAAPATGFRADFRGSAVLCNHHALAAYWLLGHFPLACQRLPIGGGLGG